MPSASTRLLSFPSSAPQHDEFLFFPPLIHHHNQANTRTSTPAKTSLATEDAQQSTRSKPNMCKGYYESVRCPDYACTYDRRTGTRTCRYNCGSPTEGWGFDGQIEEECGRCRQENA